MKPIADHLSLVPGGAADPARPRRRGPKPEGEPEPTAVQRRRIEAAVEIAAALPEQITYQHTVLCQTCLPYRDPGDEVREWERRQGVVALSLEAGKTRNPETGEFVKLGLPFGSRPRLVMVHLNATAIKIGSPRVEVGDSLTAFVRRLQGSDPNGREITAFKEQLARLAAATVRMAVEVSDRRAFQLATQIIDMVDLWLERDERRHVPWPQAVELSPRYFESLQRHAVPLDERALGALANAPLALDVYCWLAQRLHRIDPHKPQRITWKAIYDQFGQGYGRIRKFRESFVEVMADVQRQYPDARIAADHKGLELRHSRPPVLGRGLLVIRRPDPPAG